LNGTRKEYKVLRRRIKQMPTTSQADIYVCDVCGAEMMEIHCKIICPRCGFIRDCSDP
jgi:rubrerythrin